MTIARTLRTARHIPLGQLAARARFLWLRARYAAEPALPLARAVVDAAGMEPTDPLPHLPDGVLWPEGIPEVERRAAEFASGRFEYLHRAADFAGGVRWHDAGASPLWLYQLHYLGSVADLARAGRVADAARVLASWRVEFENRWDGIAWHPYPASLRLVNLCVAASCADGFERLGDGAARLASVHAAYLLRHVEHDVRGNHILENARALLWAGCAFRGGAAGDCERTARAILAREIPEQVLPDGGHFEMSPMYHCIVMRDLLEVRALLGDGDPLVAEHVTPAIARMARFLDGILCPDGGIPLLGDSVRGYGPPPMVLLALAGHASETPDGLRSFPDSGLHVFRSRVIWAIFDAGPVCPSYLPAHGQADTLTVEVWVNGAPIVCDPGVHDYSGPERAWGRSSRAHSTLTIADENTSEVHGNFRVGGRAEVASVVRGDEVAASMRPFRSSARLHRTVSLRGESLTIEDWAEGPAGGPVRSRLHLDPRVPQLRVEIGPNGPVIGAYSLIADIETGGRPCRFEDGRVAREFGRTEASTILVQDVPPGQRVRWIVGPG